MKHKMGNRKPIAALLGTVLLALAVLPVGLAHADSAAAFTNFTLSAISPVCFGSTPSVTITAGVANPSSDSCEIVITNQIWSWSASGRGVCFPPNGNGGTGWTWSNAPAGNNGITVTVNVTFQGTNCNGGFSTNISGSTNFTVPVISINLSMNNLQRVGISANGHDRTQHITVTACPSSEIGNVALTHGTHITLTNLKVDMGSGTKTFDLIGLNKSTAPGDDYVMATDNASFCYDMKTVTVIVPAAIGTNPPPFNGDVQPQNLCTDSNTSPAAWGVGPPDVYLATYYDAPLNIPIVDQFTNACGDLYDGSDILENGNPLNQTLSGSAYTDNAGFNVPLGIYDRSNPIAVNWPTNTTSVGHSNSAHDILTITVDRIFDLKPFLRTCIYTPPAHLQFIWQ